MNTGSIAGVSRIIVRGNRELPAGLTVLGTVVEDLTPSARALHGAAADARDGATLLSLIARTPEYRKGISFEFAAQAHLRSSGMDIRRNTMVDLVLDDGAMVRPDFLRYGHPGEQLFIGEVKNRDLMPLTLQLRQYLGIARANRVPLHLYMPEGSRVSRPLQGLVDAGEVSLHLIART